MKLYPVLEKRALSCVYMLSIEHSMELPVVNRIVFVTVLHCLNLSYMQKQSGLDLMSITSQLLQTSRHCWSEMANKLTFYIFVNVFILPGVD